MSELTLALNGSGTLRPVTLVLCRAWKDGCDFIEARRDSLVAARQLHWNVNANEWHYFLRGKGQVALFGSGGRGKVAEFKPGDVAYIPQGFGHAIKNVGDEDLEIVQP
jgi:mannose-6-phosphate isomerase-like protein (cupin superfamily)